MHTRILVLLFITLGWLPLRAAEPPAALRAADDARVSATLAGDATALAPLLSDSLHYSHSNGKLDSKASLLEALKAGTLRYSRLDYETREFKEAAPGLALMTGRALVQVGSADAPVQMTLAFLAVWRLEDSQWRFLAWQSCKLTPPPLK
jgi:hypothetical protein